MSASAVRRVAAGAIAGGVATWVMDLATTGLQQAQSPEDAVREKAAQPDGKSSVERMLEQAEAVVGVRIGDDLRPTALRALHYALGVAPAVGYGLLRDRVPLLGAARGMVFGLLVFTFNDEYLNSALGFAGPPEAYPMSSHTRGLVGHLVLGVTTDAVLDVLSA